MPAGTPSVTRAICLRRVRRAVPRRHAGWDPVAWADLFREVGRPLRRPRHQAPRRRAAVAHRAPQPVPRRLGSRTRLRRRPGRRRARAGHALRHVLLRRARLDVRRAADHDFAAMFAAIPQSPEYARLRRRPLARTDRPLRAVRAVERHRLPGAGDLAALFDNYYDVVPDGVVNDRFDCRQPERRRTPTSSRPSTRPRAGRPRKWESTRGIGTSFGYNRSSRDDYLSVDRAGRACSSTSPPAAATCCSTSARWATADPWTQVERLRGLGGGWTRTATPSTARVPGRPRRAVAVRPRRRRRTVVTSASRGRRPRRRHRRRPRRHAGLGRRRSHGRPRLAGQRRRTTRS